MIHVDESDKPGQSVLSTIVFVNLLHVTVCYVSGLNQLSLLNETLLFTKNLYY